MKTNVIVAAEILDRDAADCPQFAPMVKTAAQHFTVKETPADKAYLSNDNLNLVDGMGGTAFVPFKVNSIEGASAVWDRMFHYFQFRRDEFLQHYHQRSNVESAFSAIKRKFGDSVRSKTDAAMVNEVYCKLICNNICCVIMEQCVLGIEAEFWQNDDAPAGSANVLPMVRPG